LHRFALYYRDRLVDGSGATNTLTRILVLGGIDLAEARRAVADALDSELARSTRRNLEWTLQAKRYDSTTSPVLRPSQPSRGSNEIKAKEKAKIHFPFSICHFSFVIAKRPRPVAMTNEK